MKKLFSFLTVLIFIIIFSSCKKDDSPTQAPVLTLQPSANNSELNFAVNSGQNLSSQDIDLDAGAWTQGGSTILIRGAFKFDLSAIPATAHIVSAKLSLYSNPTPINGDIINANSGANNAMYIRRALTSWSSSSTWASQPATSAADQVIISHTNQATGDLTDIDVRNLVQEMIANNNGFMIGLMNENIYNMRQFASSRHPQAAKRPRLVVTYN